MNIKNLFKKKEHYDKNIFSEQDFAFKYSFKRYYIRRINGVIEFWARDERDEKLDFYLGRLVGEKVILSKAFHTHPWDVQKGGGRLIRIYMSGDDRWT